MPRNFLPAYFLCYLFITPYLFGKVDCGPKNEGRLSKIAPTIYDKLQIAIGDTKTEWPKLHVWSVENRGAIFVPDHNAIYLDQKVIRCCETFGDQAPDALAFIIAHEMTHFYQAHDWKESGLVGNFMISKVAFDANRNAEAQADVYGAFVSYQAGYNTLSLIPDLLDRIYDSYNLEPTANQAYPSLSDRKQLASDACDLAGNLIEIYQAANYLMALGHFEPAYHLYTHVAKNIQFKEVHYNIGLCNMMAYLHVESINLKYPLFIDTNTPIERGLIQRSPKTILQEALRSFRLVVEEYDPGYWFAEVPLIAIHEWLGDYDQAENLIRDFENNPEINSNPIYLASVANYYARTDRTSKSMGIYNGMLQSPLRDFQEFRDLAIFNLASIRREKIAPVIRSHTLTRNEKDLDAVPSLVFYQAFQHKLLISPSIEFEIGHENSSIISKLGWGKIKFYLQRITGSNLKSSRGLGIGNSMADIEKQYSNLRPTFTKHLGGSYVIVWEWGLIFKLDKKRIIEEWVSFSL